jgi:hypothetical protein
MGQAESAFGHHLDQIPEAELVAQVPAHTKDDYFTIEVTSSKQFLDAAQLAHLGPQFRKDQSTSRMCCLHQNRFTIDDLVGLAMLTASADAWQSGRSITQFIPQISCGSPAHHFHPISHEARE